MISPTSSTKLDYLSKGLGFLGLGSQIYGSVKEGLDTQKAYKRNAGILDEQAESLTGAKDIDQYRTKRNFERVRGEQEAAYAKAGVEMSGSPLIVALESQKEYELDKSIIDYNYKLEENKLKNKANMERYYGRVAKRQAYAKIPTLLTQMGGMFK
jgi:hypothetical protein